MEKKGYYKELKKFLNSLSVLRDRYRGLEEEEKELESDYVDTISSICTYEAIATSKTYKVNNVTEELMLQEQEEKVKRQQKLNNIRREKREIEKMFSRYQTAIDSLNDIERKIVVMSLIEHKSRVYVLREIHASDKAYYKILYAAMNKMCVILYGTKFATLGLKDFY